MLRCRS